MSTATALLITTDDLLLDDVLRLAAAAGHRVEVAHDPPAAVRAWPTATAVLVGADQAAAMAQLRPPAREQVHLVGRGALPDEQFRHALALGARDVLELPAADTWLVELLTDLGDGSPREGALVAVLAGSGGAGATTFACALALVAAGEQDTVLVDLDPLGPGVDRVVGLDPAVGDPELPLADGLAVRWDALVSASGRLGSRALRDALPRHGRLAVLGWGPRPPVALDPVAVREVLSAARRGHDLVVADLPRSVDPVTEEVLARAGQVVVLVEPTVPGVASAGRLVGRVQRLTSALGVVVRQGRGVAAAQVGEALGLPVLAELGHHRRLAEDVDLGLGPVRSRRSPLARAAREVLDGIGQPPERWVA